MSGQSNTPHASGHKGLPTGPHHSSVKLQLTQLPVDGYTKSLWSICSLVESSWNVLAHGDAREGKWRGSWRMEWVASTFTPLPNVVYPALLKLMRTPWLPAVDWTDAPTDLNGLFRFGERRNLVSACMPSCSARAIPVTLFRSFCH